jgi:hypothetical protein
MRKYDVSVLVQKASYEQVCLYVSYSSCVSYEQVCLYVFFSSCVSYEQVMSLLLFFCML